MADGETPAGDAPPNNEPMQLKFRDSNNTEVTFKLKPSTKFAKAFEAFAKKTEKKLNELRFLYDGERLNGDQSIEECDMQDGDTVDVHMEQIGGKRFAADDSDGDVTSPASSANTLPNNASSTVVSLVQAVHDMQIRIAELEARLATTNMSTDDHQAVADARNALTTATNSAATMPLLQRDLNGYIASDVPTRVLFIGNIDINVSDATLRELVYKSRPSEDEPFEDAPFGKIARYRQTGQSKGYIILHFYNIYEAEDVAAALAGCNLNGKVLCTQYAQTREEAVTARVKALQIAEQVDALPSLAQLAEGGTVQQAEEQYITLQIVNQSSALRNPTTEPPRPEHAYRVLRAQPLRAIFEQFEIANQRQGMMSLSFKFERQRLRGHYSAENYRLEDGDIIFAQAPRRYTDCWTADDAEHHWTTAN